MERVVRLALALLAGCAGLPGSGPRPELAIVADRPAVEDGAIVLLEGECSGTLVATRWVLTAAHCVEEPPLLPGVTVVSPSGRITIAARAKHVHPDALPLADGRAHDMALIELAEDVPPSIAQPLHLLLDANDDGWIGRAVRLVGWHRRPTMIGPLGRFTGWNEIRLASPGVIVTLPPRGAGAAGFRTRFGDSGSPALLPAGGREWVIGVLCGGSAAGSADSIYAATFYRPNAEWIGATLPPP